MSTGGKGSGRRPLKVSPKKFSDNWDRIFKSDKFTVEEAHEALAKPQQQLEKTMKERLTLEDDATDMILKMSNGNPGAIRALTEAFNDGAFIDPDSAWGGYSAAINLDTLGIYGSEIWILFNNQCEQNTVKFLAVIRATQLGLMTVELLKAAARNEAKLPVDDLLKQVQERLPRFGKNST